MSLAPADLRLRLLAALVLAMVLSQLQRPLTAATALALLAALALADRMPAARWRRLLHVEGFVLLLAISLPLTLPGPALLHLGPLPLSADGLARAGLLALRISAAALALLWLLGGSDPMRLGGALRALRVPERLVRLFLMTLRHTALIGAEARRLQEAMRARSFRPRSNRHSWRSLGNLVGMLLVRALERASRIEEAMRCRGGAGRFPGSALPRPARRDWLAFGLLLVAAGLAGLGDRL